MNQQTKSSATTIAQYFVGSAILLTGILLIFEMLMRYWFGWDQEKRGQYGDQFGALNAVFSGLAFLGLILTIAFQTRDLRIQTSALEAQIKEFNEQKKEMERSATAQERANALTEATLLQQAFASHISVAMAVAGSEILLDKRNEKMKLLFASSIEVYNRISDEVGGPPLKTIKEENQ